MPTDVPYHQHQQIIVQALERKRGRWLKTFRCVLMQSNVLGSGTHDQACRVRVSPSPSPSPGSSAHLAFPERAELCRNCAHGRSLNLGHGGGLAGAHGERIWCEPVGVWGQSPQWGPGEKPWAVPQNLITFSQLKDPKSLLQVTVCQSCDS